LFFWNELMTDFDYEKRLYELHHCRCCGQFRPVLQLTVDHELRCAEALGIVLEPRELWPKNS